MSTFHRCNKIKHKNGFTLIELIVVIAIIGSFMALGLKLLRSFWLKQSTGITSLEMMQLIDVAREKSLSTGKIYSLSVNTDKKIMELMIYDPEHEKSTSESESKPDKSEAAEDTKKSEKLFTSNLPSQISEFYSPAGIKLTSPIFYLHFYPDGTSDSIIIKYEDREKPFHFIPRNGGNGVFFSDLNALNHEN